MGIGPKDYYLSGNAIRNDLDNKWDGTYLNARYEFGDFVLQSISAFDGLDFNHTTQWDGVPVSDSILYYHTAAASSCRNSDCFMMAKI